MPLTALTIERLYRIRYLHRGVHPTRPAIARGLALSLSLSRKDPDDAS